MLSKALSHFPQFRFRDGRKLIWNPVHKKTFAIRPEERVRLKLLDYLILEAAFSSSRISFESPVKLPGDKSSSRTDVICYDDEFSPLLLIECKAPDIRLDEKAAVQIARYNQKVGAPYLLVSNGMLDFWFEVNGDQVEPKDEVPLNFASNKDFIRDGSYWEDRCFIGGELNAAVREYAMASCSALFGNPHQPIKYLSFDNFPSDLALSHYYRIFGLEEDIRIGISFSANPLGKTRLNMVLNQKGSNVAFLTSTLDLIGEDEDTEIHSAKGRKELSLKEEIGFNLDQDITSHIESFKQILTNQAEL